MIHVISGTKIYTYVYKISEMYPPKLLNPGEIAECMNIHSTSIITLHHVLPTVGLSTASQSTVNPIHSNNSTYM